ncbi:PBP1A family penicillin-binding protein [Cohnella laeviribosi]|uniref:transglycosylase domain-containing protein n=1 Tax=Cohnella laeviribosi TaxID=380174 RepID=UPI003D20A72C
MRKTASPGKAGKRPAKSRSRQKRRIGLIWLLFVILFAAVCAVVGYLLVILNGERILSQNIDKLNNMDKASIIVDANGNELAKMYVSEGNREYVPISKIPKLVQQAFIATEDKRFYEHSGVDLFGIARALVKDVIARSAVEGASTITQQLARNIFLSSDKTLFRKGTEASIALALENHKSKDEILEMYLNRIYFGRGQYGIKTAAKYYFGVDDLEDLKLWQIATLAGMPKAPNTYNPLKNPEKSKERRAVVLSLMEEQGYITEAQKQEAMAAEYDPSVVPEKSSRYAAFVDYVVDEAQQVLGISEEELLAGGYTIKATIDTKAQEAIEDAFADPDNFEKSVDDIPMQGSMVILNQHDGSIVAIAGGRDYSTKNLNRVTSQRQPGSSFKPIVSYGPAIETGDWFPWSTLRDDKVCYDNGKYCPTDSNARKYIGPVSMKEAIRESRNQPAVWLLNEIGVQTGVEFAGRLGIELGPDDRNLAIALGGLTHGVTPIQMARAYAAFANGGLLPTPHSISEITDASGDIVYEFKPPKNNRVMKEETAYYVTDILKGVVEGGTGKRAKISGRTVAGKTGTTQLGLKGIKDSAGNRDVWFVGYTPELTAAVWMGYDKTDKDHYVKNSSGQAAALFSKVMSKVLKNYEKQSFPEPSGIQKEAQGPGAVTGLTANYNSQQVSVELSWNAVEGDGITYKIYRKEASEAGFSLLAETAEPAYEDMAILPEMTYTYYVKAYSSALNLEGKPSAGVTVKVTTELDTSPEPGPDEGTGLPSDNPDEGNGTGDGTITDGTGNNNGEIGNGGENGGGNAIGNPSGNENGIDRGNGRGNGRGNRGDGNGRGNGGGNAGGNGQEWGDISNSPSPEPGSVSPSPAQPSVPATNSEGQAVPLPGQTP